MTGTDVARFTHKQSRSYLNHLVIVYAYEISTSPRGLGILSITLLAGNCQNLKMAAIGRNM